MDRDNHNNNRFVPMDKLKDLYKHCIMLNASNKISTKNAFDLHLIDHMQDLVSGSEDGQMNFKVASSALDVGAKIYSNRVDCVQSDAQKVASSILMALDGQKGDTQLNESDAANDVSNASDRMDGDEEAQDGPRIKKIKKKIKRNVKTVVDATALDAKLEQVILGDPYLDGLSEDFDMSCAASLISANSLTQPNCLLTLDSDNFRRNYRDTLEPSDERNYHPVTLLTSAGINCAQILRKHLTVSICPRLSNFLFNDRTTTIAGLNENLDESANGTLFQDRNRVPDTSIHAFDPDHYDDCAANYDCDTPENGFNEQNENDPIPDLDKVVAGKPSDYVYTGAQPRLLNTWAGPTAWKVPRVPQTTKKEPKSTRKRKLEKLPIEWSEEVEKPNEDIADKMIRHSADALRKWQEKRLFRPQDHNYDEETAINIISHTWLKAEDTYHCVKTPAEALKTVEQDHDYENRQNSADEAPNSPGFGGFDNVHDDSDDEFRADPVVDGNEVAIYGAEPNMTLSQQADLEFAGENLIEQPDTVQPAVIQFAKFAKKLNIRKVKNAISLLLHKKADRTQRSLTSHDITVIENGTSNLENTCGDQLTVREENDEKEPLHSESMMHCAFSEVYTDLSEVLGPKIAKDLSQPIAFVTLLHLANEQNLRLIPNKDLKNFFIEQDELTT